MESRILDTDVFSFFFKQDSRAGLYEAEIRGYQLCLCFQTVAEIKAWAMIRNWGEVRRQRLDQTLANYLVLPYDSLMADAWALITASGRRDGHPIECGDAWIAAAALRHDVTLLSHNGKHYENVPGLQLITHA